MTNVMKPFEYYSKPQTPYPDKADYTTVFVYDNGEVIWEGFLEGYNEAKVNLNISHPNCVIQRVVNEKAYREHQQKYGEEIHKLHEEFQNSLYQEFGVSDNPKRHKAFNYAWERGHAHGASEVYTVFERIVELIQ